MAGKSAGRSTTSGSIDVSGDDGTWSPAEVAELKETLRSEIARLRDDLAAAQEDLVGLVQDTQDIVGDDQADVGSKAIEREHEAAMAANTRDVLTQYEHALERVESDLHGVCEGCGGTIPKLRVQAFPRATLCVTCKAAQKR
ncbi:TraR/DksA family transcriptional regulator [Arsenicicoccus dermatophilus]|uniref:TraR/DksA family transcriptional regulator n=1 Tax=Arsenicicoccus dermatophilus TaxID=1076331 RepID=UPI0039174AAA